MSPAEIEGVLLAHPRGLIEDAVVVGVHIPKGGKHSRIVENVPRAWIILSKEGRRMRPEAAQQEINTWVKKTLSRYKWLKGGITFVETVRLI